MDGERQLGSPAVEAIAMTAHWSFIAGWQVTIQHRHSGSSGWTCAREVYDHLTTEELVDVLSASLDSALLIPHRERLLEPWPAPPAD